MLPLFNRPVDTVKDGLTTPSYRYIVKSDDIGVRHEVYVSSLSTIIYSSTHFLVTFTAAGTFRFTTITAD